MEFLSIVLLIIILIILLSVKTRMDEQLKFFTKKLEEVRLELRALKEQKKSQEGIEIKPTPKIQDIPKVEPVIELKPEVKDVPKPEIKPEFMPLKDKVISRERPPVKQPKQPTPSFFEKHPDLEKFIGENLINKIGIAVLVLGIGFFVKYAIDKEWINEIGRTFIGILCGAILIGVAHRLRKEYKAFSSVLVGGGIAIFYFTISIAFRNYDLLNQTAAFVVMIIITAFAVFLAILYDKIELAVIAMIGGFASPILVSNGSGNYIILFTYILVLNAGMIVLAYFKKWQLLNIISFAFTVILYAGWLIKYVYDIPTAPYQGALIFATLFYFTFFIMNIINNIRENRKFLAAEITILILNTFLYYAAGMVILDNIHDGLYKGLFTAVIAIFNFIFAFTLFKTKKVDINLVYLLIGLVLTFLSLTAPVQLKGNNISLFWAAEAVLLLWLSQRSGIEIIKLGSILLNILLVISISMDWIDLYAYETTPMYIIVNRAFITGFVTVISFLLTFLLLKKEQPVILKYIDTKTYRFAIAAILGITSYFVGMLEINHQLKYYYPYSSIAYVAVGGFNFLYASVLILLFRKQTIELKMPAYIVAGLAVLSYLLFYNIKISDLRNEYLTSEYTNGASYYFHYVVVLLFAFLLFIFVRDILTFVHKKTTGFNYVWWVVTFVSVYLLSAELDNIVVVTRFQPGFYITDILEHSHKIGFAILWGLCSLLLMVVGMRSRIKVLRVISLSLFFITLVKLFVFDLRNISEGGKIAAFICLGILLLVVSFMYQKLKTLLFEDNDVKLNS